LYNRLLKQTGCENKILLIEVDPYRFPQQHAKIIQDFGPEVNLANVTPGQVLRLEGFRRGIGRAVDYSLLER
jgi:phosphosulfolactate synthase